MDKHLGSGGSKQLGGLVDDFRQDKVSIDGKNQQEISSYGGSLRFDWDFGAATLTSITGFEKVDNMLSRGDIDGGYGAAFLGEGNYGPGFIPFPSESADGIPNLDQFTQEFRLASNGNSVVDWLFGAFYFNEDFQADTFSFDSLAPDNPRDGYAFQTQEATSYALFGSLDFHLHWYVAACRRVHRHFDVDNVNRRDVGRTAAVSLNP